MYRRVRRLLGLNGRVRRFLGFLNWAYPIVGDVVRTSSPDKRRLLAIYDLSTQPFSIGDVLVIQEGSLVLREKYHLNLVDFALVYDPQYPSSSDPSFNSINESNALYHLASILPVAQVNQHLGSLFVFNSHLHLQRFICDNKDLYHVWPEAQQFRERDYLYYHVYNDLLYNYYREHQTIPRLSCRSFLIDWAQTFYHERVYPAVPVTVQVRNNKVISTVRNLHLDSWLDFFSHCEDRYPVKFIVICARSEVDDRLRQRRNIIIAKDYGTTIEQDLALIHTAAIHMGASSGPASMAIFNTKPYLIVNTDLVPHLYRDIIQEDGFLRLHFSSPLQRFTVGRETTGLLITEFDRMWSSIDKSGLKKQEDKVLTEPLTWLR
jgi:hypothetical protein